MNQANFFKSRRLIEKKFKTNVTVKAKEKIRKNEGD